MYYFKIKQNEGFFMNNIHSYSRPVSRSYRRPRKRKPNYFKITVITVALLIIGIVSVSLLNALVRNRQPVFSINPFASITNSANNNNWELTLVNPTHPISKSYSPELTALANGNQVDVRMYPYLQEMFDDARAVGLCPEVTSGYRSTELQQQLYDNEIANYQAQGYSYEEAEEIAKHWVAYPGTSEHHTGLAVDISAAENSGQESEDIYPWFIENCYKYGFILRYPEDKTDITKINYEPWHYRYVGKEVAEEIHQKGICLEEYLEMI